MSAIMSAALSAAAADRRERPGWTWRRTPDELRALLPELDARANDRRLLLHMQTEARFMGEDARITLDAIGRGVTAPASVLT